jgi:threonine/homoserine/homoserine lactone efflux protein
VFYTNLLPSLVPTGSPHLWSPLLVATHVVLSLAWLLGYAAALSRSRSVLGRPPVRTVLDRVTGCVLIGFGVRVAAQAR